MIFITVRNVTLREYKQVPVLLNRPREFFVALPRRMNLIRA
jgi:hypothetical protein